jgi:hypothetical protein
MRLPTVERGKIRDFVSYRLRQFVGGRDILS